MTDYVGDDLDNTITGGSGDDRIIGRGGDDLLSGGAGNDIFVYDTRGFGSDTITDFYTHGDKLDLSAFNIADFDSLTPYMYQDGLDVVITLGWGTSSEVIRLEGVSLAGLADSDFVFNTSTADLNVASPDPLAPYREILFGGLGDDTIDGGAGDDALNGGSGDDTLLGGDGHDHLNGNAGDDWIVEGPGSDTIFGGDGFDTVDFSGTNFGVNATIYNFAFRADDLTGGWLASMHGLERMIGSSFDDYLQGDYLPGGELDGGGGNDILVGSSSLKGGDGNDELRGLNANGTDTLDGGAGNDRLEGGQGGDILSGGTGVDTAGYMESSAGVTVTLGGSVSGGDAQGDVLADDFENLAGSAYADTLTGDAGDNELWGYNGRDTLHGGDGDDILHGGTESDFLYGGSGDDILSDSREANILDGGGGFDLITCFDRPRGVTVNLAAGTGPGGTLLSIEAVNGSRYTDTLIGSTDANTLRGSNGDDVLQGAGGDDTLEGGVGADRLDGGDGTDLANYADSTAGVTVNLATGIGSGGTATGDSLTSIESITGSAYADTLTGNAAANVLRGGAGADHLDGGAGSDLASYADSSAGVTVNLATGIASGGTATGDTLASIELVTGSRYADTLTGSAAVNTFRGGAGADRLDGGAGFDTANYADSTVGVTVNLATGIGSSGTAYGDRLMSIESITGSAYADTLAGSSAANTLTGAGGQDLLRGGSGADRFAFAAVGDSATGAANADRIADFSHAQGDRIDLSQIDANGSAAGNQPFSFIGTAAYAGVAGQLRYAVSGTDAVIGGDVNGDGVSDFNIVLSNAGSLQAADFVL